MGLDSTVQQLILVKGNTDDAKAAIRSLRGVEKQMAKERLAEIEQHNKGIESQIAMWGKVAIGIGAAVGAFKLAQHAAKSYLEDVRLQAAAGSANLERLQKATNGLVEADNLLAFAGKAQAGVWRLNQQEMETVLQGAMALRKTMGVELNPTIDKLTEAIAKGSTRALKEFGIEAKDKQDALGQLSKMYRGLGGDASLAGDGIEAASVKWKDAIDDLIGALGQLVTALEPVIRGAANVASTAAEAATSSDWILQAMGRGELGTKNQQLYRQLMDRREQAQASVEAMGANQRLKANAFAVADVFMDAFREQAVKRVRGGGRASGGGGGDPGDPVGAVMAAGGGASRLGAAFQNTFLYAGNQRLGFQNASMAASEGAAAQGQLAALDETNKAIEQFTLQMEQAARIEEMVKQRRQSMLESIFGPVGQFNAYAAGFQILQSAAASAFDAWITGSQSLGEAIKHAIAEGLRAMAIQMLMESIKHLAFAAGNAAFGNFAGAGAHLKSAALFGAGAIAVGAAAKQMGAGSGYSAGGSVPSGTSAGGYLGSSGGSGTPQTSNTVIYVTGDAYRMSQAEREHRISDAARRGQQKRSSNVVAHR